MKFEVEISTILRAGFTVLLLSFYSNFSSAQDPIFKPYQIEDGLLSDETHFTLSDSKGYIWIASDAGINKFDGHSFKSFTEMDGLPESTVLRLYEDRKGRLWFSTLSSYVGYIEKDIVHVIPFKFKEEVTSNNENFAYSIHVDKGDTLWVGTIFSGLLFKLAPPYTGKPVVKRFQSDFILEFDQAGGFVYGTLSSFGAGYTIDCIRKWNGSQSTFFYSTERMQRRKNIVRLGTDQYLFESNNSLYGILNGKISLLHTFQNSIIFISGNTTTGIWIGVYDEGVYRVNNLNSIGAAKPIFKDFSITSRCVDFEGGQWFTSIEDGVLYVPDLHFKAVFKGKSYEDIVVQEQGKFIVNETQGDVVIYEHGKAQKVPLSALAVFYFEDEIYYYNLINSQQVYNIQKRNTRPLKVNDPSRYTSVLKSFSEHDGIIVGWHIYQLYIKDKSSEEFNHKLTTRTRINCAVMSDEHSVWIGTIDGLLHFDPSTGKVVDYSKMHRLLGSRIDKIVVDEKQNLWLATRGQGVILLSKNKKIEQITRDDGLPSDIVISIQLDDKSNAWVGTNEGLCKISLLPKGRVELDDFSYLSNFELGTIHAMAILKNELYLTTSNGVFTFPINRLLSRANSVKLPLYFTSVANDEGRIIGSNEKLEYNHNSLKINFLAISYARADDIYYEYKLDGFHRKWFRTNNQSVELLNIPPGSYVFRIRAVDGGTVLSQNQLSFAIKIPFWRTWWFYVVTILFGALLVWLVVRWRIRVIRRKEKERSDIEISFANLEAQALRAQMNPHFIFNSLNSIQRIYTEGNLNEANAFLSEFGQLIRKILENSGRTVIPLKEEIETLELYLNLEKFRCKEKFSYQIEIDPAIDTYYMTIPSLIIQPFVENAIWHGIIPSEREGFIAIRCTIVASGIKISVKDNGVGIQEATKSQHISKGIEMSEKRIGSKINILSKVGEGTEVWFILKGQDD